LTARVRRLPTIPAGVDTVLATLADGRALLAISAPVGVRQIELDPGVVGSYVLRDEWSDTESPQELDGSPWLSNADLVETKAVLLNNLRVNEFSLNIQLRKAPVEVANPPPKEKAA